MRRTALLLRALTAAGAIVAVAGCGASPVGALPVSRGIADDVACGDGGAPPCGQDADDLAGGPAEPEGAGSADRPSPEEEALLNECLALGTPADPLHAELFELLNEYRQANGRPTLEYSVNLQAAADLQAERMFRDGFFDHVWPDGTKPSDRALAAGFCHDRVGENLAYGLNCRQTAAEVMLDLTQSPSHDENMLYEPYRYVGIGVYYVVSERGDEYWWVQLMAPE